MRSLGVVPARLASTRLPEKPLHKIAGREMVLRVLEAAKRSRLDKVVVATDSERVVEVVQAAGGEAVMTSPECATGTDRVLQALLLQPDPYDLVLNIQGDEPLLNFKDLDLLLDRMEESPKRNMATLARPLQSEDEIDNLNSVKVLLDRHDNAIYFSRWPIPFSRQRDLSLTAQSVVLSHIGLYAFRTAFLKEYCDLGSTGFERAESLEQLRALWMGEKIHVAETTNYYRGVDSMEDVLAVENILKVEQVHGE